MTDKWNLLYDDTGWPCVLDREDHAYFTGHAKRVWIENDEPGGIADVQLIITTKQCKYCGFLTFTDEGIIELFGDDYKDFD